MAGVNPRRFGGAGSGGGSGATTLDELTDVVIDTPAARHFLVHDGTDWDNRAIEDADLPAGLTRDAEAAAAYQPLDSDLTAIAALTASNDDIVQRKAGAWTNRTIAQLKADLGSSSLIRKTSDQTKNNNTTLATITDLTFSADANSVYEVQWRLLVEAASAASDWKFALTLPAGATAFFGGEVNATSSGWGVGTGSTSAVVLALSTEASTVSASSGANVHGILFSAIVIIAGTSGTVGLQFAQNTADISNNTIKTNSLLRYQKAA